MGIFEVIVWCAICGAVFAVSGFFTSKLLRKYLGDFIRVRIGDKEYRVRIKPDESIEQAMIRARKNQNT